MLISELITDIRTKDLVLPEFQREYVWSREQAKQLLVSLTRKFPIGGLLLWKTQDPPALKNMESTSRILGTVQVILDGQQRLTTLYMLVTGEIPPYYVSEDISTEVRDLYYNLEDGDLQYFQPVRMRENPRWVKVVDCFDGDAVNVFNIARGIEWEEEDAFSKAQTFATNLSKLRNIREYDIPIQVVPIEATLTDAIDVFDRVNSLGTSLTEAELALTHVTGKWPLARRTLKSKSDLLKQQGFEFDLTLMTRALVATVTDHALFEHIHSVPREALEYGWERLSRILDYLASIFPSRAFIDSTRDMSSKNPLIPVVRFLGLNGGSFQSDESLRRGLHWFYMAQIHQRYAGQTDSRLEHDVTIVNRENSPWHSLIDQIVDQRGRTRVLPDDLEGRGVSHPLYTMSLVLAKSRGALDWFNGLSLTAGVGSTYAIHSHHIFPQSVLYSNGFSSDSHLDRQTVNSIANRAFLTAETNINIKNRLPEEYLPEVEERFPGSLQKQFIPFEPNLWKLESFHEFLDARRMLLAEGMNNFLEGLIREDEQEGVRPLSELIAMGEGVSLEFKSTLQWDVVSGELNRSLRDSVLKTLVAFMNSEGGTLLIGVEDGGQVFGLEKDLSLVGGSIDRFLQVLNSLVADRIGVQYAPYALTRVEPIDGRPICVVSISKSTEPAFLSGPRGREFYVRIGNTTRALDPEQTISYLENSIH